VSSGAERVEGRLSVHPRGFGFLDHGEGSAFVPPPRLRGFLAGDLVRAELVPEDDGRASVRGLELVDRWRTELFGRCGEGRGGQPVLEVDPRVGSSPWPLAKVPRGVRPGDHLVAELQGEKARVVRVVPPEEAGLQGVLVDWGIRTSFPPEAEAEAKGRRRPRKAGRRDLRDVHTLTIDGPSTLDIDDALAVLPSQADGAVRVLVSIADVDDAVAAGSALDLEARARGTSVYLPGHVVPMPPRVLSEGRLSLLPDQERAAVTVELRIDPEGEVAAVDVYTSLIVNHARLTYTAVAAFLDEGDVEAVPAESRETLRWLRTAAARLSAVRDARGGVTSFSRSEMVLDLDPETGEPVGLKDHEENCAHRLIERLMVAANEAVARWLFDRGLPALYRAMPEPEPERVERLSDFARQFGFEAGFGQRMSPRALAAFEDQFLSARVAPALRTVVRRTLGRADYTPHAAPHFALGSNLYLHFTSPIRRYADLVVHRVIKAHLRGEREQDPGDPELEGLADHLNDAAYRAKKAETERERMLVAKLFAGRIGEAFAANVVQVKGFGLVVQLAGLGVTGTVSSEELAGGPFHLDVVAQALVGKRRRYGVGEPIEVVMANVDEELGRLEFTPAGRKAQGAAKPRGQRAPASGGAARGKGGAASKRRRKGRGKGKARG
jgi:ribonuclease R